MTSIGGVIRGEVESTRRRNASRLSAAVLLAALACALPGAARAEEEADAEFTQRRDALLKEATDGFLTLVQKLNGMELHRERDATAERLLRFLPENAALRSMLKYKRDAATKAWTRSSYKLPRNYKPELLAAVPALRKDLVGTPLEGLWTLFQESEAVPRAVRRRLLEDLISLDPDDARFREANEEVKDERAKKDEDPWILVETREALRRRQEIADAVTAAGGEVPEPKDGKVTDEDVALGVSWSTAVETPFVRVLTAGGYGESIEIARACHASVTFFHRVLGIEQAVHQPLTIGILAFPGQKEQVIARIHASDAFKEFLRTRTSGFHVPGTSYVILATGTGPGEEADSTRGQRRKDTAVRYHFDGLFTREFGSGVATPPGLLQGLGLFMTHRLVGTRLTVFIEKREDRYAHDDDPPGTPKLEDSNSDWLFIARTWDERGRLPHLTESLALALNDLKREDLLLLYCFARYLVEGRPGQAKEFLRACGRNDEKAGVTGIDKAAQETLGLPLLDLDVRLRRWVREFVRLAAR